MNAEYQQPDAKDAKDSRRTQKGDQNFDGDFSHEIIGAAVEVQRVLGVGLLESAYAAALAIELAERGLRFEREVPVSGRYKGQDVGVACRADFIVENSLIIEIKATEADPEIYRAQVLSYLRLAGLKLGLLINFHTYPVVKGIQRLVNKL
jgi:GxxExxY protein